MTIPKIKKLTKKIFFLSLILFTINSNAQDNDWAIQANLNPFFLGNLNSEDSQDVKSNDISGGYDIGLSIKYNLSKIWQLEGGIRYSKQTYNGEVKYFVPEGSDYHSELNYIKVPLLANYSWDWDYKKDLKLSFGVGGQLLILNDYYLKIEDRLQIITVINEERTLYNKEMETNQSVFGEEFFSKNRLGLVGQFGVEKQISNSFSYSIKLRTEYDTGLIDNDNGFNYDLNYFRIGLQLGIQFDIKKTNDSYVKGIL